MMVPMTFGGGDVIVEINDKGNDKRVEVEKVGPAGGVTNGQTAVEGPTIPEAPPALLFWAIFYV